MANLKKRRNNRQNKIIRHTWRKQNRSNKHKTTHRHTHTHPPTHTTRDTHPSTHTYHQRHTPLHPHIPPETHPSTHTYHQRHTPIHPHITKIMSQGSPGSNRSILWQHQDKRLQHLLGWQRPTDSRRHGSSCRPTSHSQSYLSCHNDLTTGSLLAIS